MGLSSPSTWPEFQVARGAGHAHHVVARGLQSPKLAHGPCLLGVAEAWKGWHGELSRLAGGIAPVWLRSGGGCRSRPSAAKQQLWRSEIVEPRATKAWLDPLWHDDEHWSGAGAIAKLHKTELQNLVARPAGARMPLQEGCTHREFCWVSCWTNSSLRSHECALPDTSSGPQLKLGVNWKHCWTK